MKSFLRIVAAFITALSTFFFVFWLGSALLLRLNPPRWVAPLGAMLAALAATRYVWTRSASCSSGLVSSVAMGALVTGGIGFAGGFFGPLLFAPGANQGPLLGLFITGPLGFVLGAVGGAVYWLARRSHSQQ